MRYAQLLQQNRFSVITSLPRNELKLAEAALKGGAEAIKVHCNVYHRASGQVFGSYSENRGFLKSLIALCGPVPVGLMPGGPDGYITVQERLELEEMGLAFFTGYAHQMPCQMMDSTRLDKMVAIGPGYTQNTLDAVRASDIDVLECSIQPGEAYGTPLCVEDLLRYSDIATKTAKPCVVTTQRAITPQEVHHLAKAGCKGIMIGAVVMGPQQDAAAVEQATRAFCAAAKELAVTKRM